MAELRASVTAQRRSIPGLDGTLEMDETYVGSKPRKLSKQAKEKLVGEGKPIPKPKRGRGTRTQPVVAVVERSTGGLKGRVRTRVAADVTAANLREVLRENVKTSARIVTDELNAYPAIMKGYTSHATVKHGEGEYVRGDVHSNTVEGFFSLVKRLIYGIYHNVSRKPLPRAA